MPDSSIDALDTTFQKTNIWLQDLMQEMGVEDRQHAYSALSAVLHALRDNLTVDETAQLGAQLPMLITGMYYQGWKPAGKPVRERMLDEFLQRVDAELRNRSVVIDAHNATESVFRVLSKRVTEGEIDDVVGILPSELKQLWPEAA
ncbi:MAG: DUF2267 domain-containing protein [Dehalococcoidia bacterium]